MENMLRVSSKIREFTTTLAIFTKMNSQEVNEKACMRTKAPQVLQLLSQDVSVMTSFCG